MIAKPRMCVLLIGATACLAASCAAIRPPDAGGPKSGPPYPVLFTEQAQRTEDSYLALNRLVPSGGQSDVHLQPITAAIKSIPTSSSPLYLPKVGVGAEMTEEENREALRRFISDWQDLIGANPAHLSLIERIDRADGVKIARYEQRPFRYPLRGGYGHLEIQFLPNRVLRNLTSSCIPEAERLQASLGPVTPRITSEEAVKQLRGTDITYTDANGQQVVYRVTATEEIAAVELVTYVVPAIGRTDALELHIAWEIAIGTTSRRLVYLDAVEGKVVGATSVP